VSLAWLAIAVAALVAAGLVGWPAWTASRERTVRDTNTERYLAWRGRGRERPPASEGSTAEERRRMVMAAALAVVGVVGLVGFFVTS
jgi:hypothetical protein